MQWLVLILVTFLYISIAYLTFSDEHRKAYYFFPVCLFINLLSSSLWFITVRYLDNKEKIFLFGLFWDTVMVAVFYIMPLFFGIKLDRLGMLGLCIMLVGLFIIKYTAFAKV